MFVRMPFNKGNILIKKFYVKDTEVAGKKNPGKESESAESSEAAKVT